MYSMQAEVDTMIIPSTGEWDGDGYAWWASSFISSGGAGMCVCMCVSVCVCLYVYAVIRPKLCGGVQCIYTNCVILIVCVYVCVCMCVCVCVYAQV